jgi:hypothetical protein
MGEAEKRALRHATPDRAGARPYHGVDLIPYVNAPGRLPGDRRTEATSSLAGQGRFWSVKSGDNRYTQSDGSVQGR